MATNIKHWIGATLLIALFCSIVSAALSDEAKRMVEMADFTDEHPNQNFHSVLSSISSADSVAADLVPDSMDPELVWSRWEHVADHENINVALEVLEHMSQHPQHEMIETERVHLIAQCKAWQLAHQAWFPDLQYKHGKVRLFDLLKRVEAFTDRFYPLSETGLRVWKRVESNSYQYNSNQLEQLQQHILSPSQQHQRNLLQQLQQQLEDNHRHHASSSHHTHTQ